MNGDGECNKKLEVPVNYCKRRNRTVKISTSAMGPYTSLFFSFFYTSVYFFTWNQRLLNVQHCFKSLPRRHGVSFNIYRRAGMAFMGVSLCPLNRYMRIILLTLPFSVRLSSSNSCKMACENGSTASNCIIGILHSDTNSLKAVNFPAISAQLCPWPTNNMPFRISSLPSLRLSKFTSIMPRYAILNLYQFSSFNKCGL